MLCRGGRRGFLRGDDGGGGRRVGHIEGRFKEREVDVAAVRRRNHGHGKQKLDSTYIRKMLMEPLGSWQTWKKKTIKKKPPVSANDGQVSVLH